MHEYDWDEVHDQIVGECFTNLTLDQAVALVGVLNEYRIEYSNQLRGIIGRTRGWTKKSKPPQNPLTLLDAVSSVSRIFHLDGNLLMTRYQQSWEDMRDGTVVRTLKTGLEGHRFVEELVPFSEIP